MALWAEGYGGGFAAIYSRSASRPGFRGFKRFKGFRGEGIALRAMSFNAACRRQALRTFLPAGQSHSEPQAKNLGTRHI